jgi:hypothetical protein
MKQLNYIVYFSHVMQLRFSAIFTSGLADPRLSIMATSQADGGGKGISDTGAPTIALAVQGRRGSMENDGFASSGGLRICFKVRGATLISDLSWSDFNRQTCHGKPWTEGN